MVIESVDCYRLHIPFRVAFSHSSATRTETESLWVEVHSDAGLTGFGESCPRDYVTGETLVQAVAWVRQYTAVVVSSIRSLEDLIGFEDAHRKDIDMNPAAWCALELALLDLLAKENNQSVEALTGSTGLKRSYRYSAVLGDASPEKFKIQLDQYMKMGFSDYKVKLSGDLDRDAAKLALLRKYPDNNIRVRVDANNLWTDPNVAIESVKTLGIMGVSLEEPLMPNQYLDMIKVAACTGAKVILDESFLREGQFDELSVEPDAWMINLRVSKMGGILRSLQIIRRARRIGVPLIIGAQVGETSLLTRAALILAGAAREALYAQEGAFGTHLLAEDICDPVLMFGKRGLLALPDWHGPGFGLKIIERKYLESC